MTTRLHRRDALKLGATAGLGYLFTGPAFSVAKAAGSNGKLYIAGVGVGGKGRSDIQQAGAFGEVVALCDIDEADGHLGGAAKLWPMAKKFFDFRKLFEDKEIMKTLDAVTISTPDHTHALAAVLAMRQGKHVYVQKPLTRTVFEARTLMEVARKYKVCTQMGNQGSAATGLRRAVELIQDGVIGDIKEAHVWTNRPIWPQAPKYKARPAGEDKIPPTIHWDEFIGPAPMRPYVAAYPDGPDKGKRIYHSFAWRGWWDFGTGAIGDMACHTANMAFRALKLAHPTKVSAQAGDVNAETCPSWAHVVLDFPARDKMPAVKLNWYEGLRDGKKMLPPEDLVARAEKAHGGKKLVASGSILVGSKGILYSPDDYGAQFFTDPADLLAGKEKGKLERTPENNGGDPGQKKEWIEAIKAGKPSMAYSNFDIAALLTEAFLLGNVAIRTGKPFEWDGPAFKVSGNPDAMKYIKQEYRKGWDMLEEKA
jgi:predicted dehydrogenase